MHLRTAPGSLLAASPDLLDPNFMHAVVLMCQHADEGAYGLVVNRPAEVTIDTLLPDHPVLGGVPFPVHAGGPVGLDTLQFLHSVGEEIPGGVAIVDGLWLGGDLDALARLIAADVEAARRRVRLIVGYSGWGAGQLDRELATGSWLPAAISVDLVFEEDPQGIWRRAVRSIGNLADGLADLPPDVSWN
jgi:putative transcriptional regulator